MFGVVVATHGTLGQALFETASQVVAGADRILCAEVRPDDSSTSYEVRLRSAVEAVAKDAQGVLVLTDMFGGTPSTIAMTLHATHEVEVVTGVNLPMLIKVLQLKQHASSLAALAAAAKASALRSIAIASEVLGVQPQKGNA